MHIRAATTKDILAWWELVHESYEIIEKLILDKNTFYQGFDEYMDAKIRQNEAFLDEDGMNKKCLGIVGFSKKHNRVTFLQVVKVRDFRKIGRELMEATMNRLDKQKEITVNVIKSDAGLIQEERRLYKSLGFIEDDKTIDEAGVPARQMKRPPIKNNMTRRDNGQRKI